MNKIFKKQNIMPIAVLGAICIVVAALLALVNSFTSKEIERQRIEAANAGNIEVLPNLDVMSKEVIEVDSEKYPKEVKTISKFDIGYVIETEVKGNASGMVVLVGIDNSGKVTGVKVIKNGETPSYWATVEPEVTGENGAYNGKTADTLEAHLVTGATNSSNGVYKAVKIALDAFTIVGGGTIELPPPYTAPEAQMTDEEILAIAGELVEGNDGFVAVDFDAESYDAKYLARVFKEKSGKGYVAYVVSISSYYGSVETENIIHIGNDGKIKSIKKITWSVSAANPDSGYNPPSDEALDEFYKELDGKNSETISDVDLKTGATNTTKTLVASITEALTIVGDLIREDMPTPEEDVLALGKEMVGADAEFTDVTPEENTFAKRIYRENSGKGYLAYLVVINERYNRIETETLVFVDTAGKINGLKKIIWKTSDAGWGYVPPTDEVVDPFYASLVGKNLADLEALSNLETNDGQLVTGATTTSKALVGALIEGVKAIETLIKKDMPTPEEDIFAFGKEMIGADSEFTDVTPEENTFVKRIYRENSGKGYLAYLVVINERYNRIETETLIYVGNEGKIKDIEKIIWKTSDAGWGYVPPTDEVVDPFYASLIGKNLADLEALSNLETNDGQLVTGATTTSKALVGALIEGVKAIETLIKKDMPTPEEDVKALIGQLFGDTSGLIDVTPAGTNYIKRLYKYNDGNGYVAYIATVSPNYGTVDTETLVLINDEAKITHVEKMLWKTSEEGWGYVPPSEVTVNAFYKNLIGYDLEEFTNTFIDNDEAELVANATNTSARLVASIAEALLEASRVGDISESEPSDEVCEKDSGNIARIIGIAVLSVMIISIAAYVAVPKIIRRRKAG